jgi:hypothetical protein
MVNVRPETFSIGILRLQFRNQVVNCFPPSAHIRSLPPWLNALAGIFKLAHLPPAAVAVSSDSIQNFDASVRLGIHQWALPTLTALTQGIDVAIAAKPQ